MNQKVLNKYEQQAINSVLIESSSGLRTFELVQGDILADPADLLVLSTHHNPKIQPTGLIISSIKNSFGFDIDVSNKWLNFSGGILSCIQIPPKNFPFSCILIMRIADSQKQDDPVHYYDTAVQGTFSSICALEFTGKAFSTISLPVLSGQRVIDYQQAVASLLRHGVEWLRRSIYTKRLRYYVFEEAGMAAWDDAMNACLGRSYVDTGKKSILCGLCREIVHVIDKYDVADEIFARILNELRDTLGQPNHISPQRVAIVGHKLAEYVAERLCQIANVTVKRELVNNIEALRKTKVADWVLSYLNSLRVFGNESVHEIGSRRDKVPSCLGENDLVSILSAIRSVIDFWQNSLTALENKSKPLNQKNL